MGKVPGRNTTQKKKTDRLEIGISRAKLKRYGCRTLEEGLNLDIGIIFDKETNFIAVKKSIPR